MSDETGDLDAEHELSEEDLEGDEPEAPEVPDDDIEERDPYKRRVAIVLAALGVVGAWIGILHNDSGRNESTFARETTRAAVSSLRANVNQSTVEGLGTDLDAEREALGVAAAFEADEPDSEVDPALVEDLERSAEVAAGIDAADREGLERELTREAAFLDLKRQALAETRVTYNNRTSQYETVLTTLAVALFLVGFTLVLNRRVRPPVLVPGLLLAAYVAGWALYIHQRDIPTTETAAIGAAADGAVHDAFGEFEAAAADYTTAIDLDDDFAPAYTGRSVSAFLAVNPDFLTNLGVVEPDGGAAQQALADAEEAIRLSEGDDLGALVVSGVYRFYNGDFDGAAERFNEAIDVNERAPEAFLLLSAAELARGDFEASEAALGGGVALLDLDGASDANRAFAADLFSLLEFVEQAVPERAEEVASVRGGLAVGEASLVFGEEVSGEAPTGAGFTVDDVVLDESGLTTTVSYTGLPADSRVSLYVFEQPAEGAPFAQSSELARFFTLEGSGTVSGVAEIERVCQPVALRYDFYIDGGLVDSLDAPGGEPIC